MNIIYINTEITKQLDDWGQENKRLVLINGQYNRNYFPKCKIILGDSLLGHYLFVEEKKDYIKMTLHEKDGMIAKIKAYYTPDGENDYALQISSTYEMDDNLTHIVKSAVSTYFLVNSFFIYGNITEDREVIITSKTQGNDKVFTFRKFEDKLYAIQTTAHKSPEGIFSVRGHFRKYKDGKIIWIDEYLKGVNKE